ncbi:MAG: hypothetical protein KF718_23505 [Polyangiaceae bacterium]|nr:hypothetical protein [Polyangiaceae bacterium]
MRLLRLTAAGFATLVAGPSLADTLGAQVHYSFGQGSFDGVELSAPAALDEPQLLEGRRPRLRGMGTLQGGSLRADLLLDRWRLGAGASLFSVSEVRLATDALPFGVTARVDQLWTTAGEVFVGYEVRQGPVYGYVDGRLSLQVLQAQLDTYVAPHGHVGSTSYAAVSPGVGPRFGALIPIGHSLMVDVNVYRQVLGGFEQLTLSLGVGYWENDRRDEFSDHLRRGPRGDF